MSTAVPTTTMVNKQGSRITVNSTDVDHWRGEGFRTEEEINGAAKAAQAVKEKAAQDVVTKLSDPKRPVTADELDALSLAELLDCAKARGVQIKQGAKRADVVAAMLAKS